MNKMKTLLSAALVAGALGGGTAQAGVISGGSSMLNAGSLSQLESWLGQGDLSLTNIFTKTANDTSYTWHAAVDGQGATFTVMEWNYLDAQGQAQTDLVGGYNPQSWDQSSNYHYTSADSERTAFLFNLTTGALFSQCLIYDSSCGYGYGSYYNEGQYQTYNSPYYGPTFGGGHDLYVTSDLDTAYSYIWSYGTGGYNQLSYNTSYGLNVGAMETFTLELNAVPEPASLALFGGGLVALGWVRRRKNAA
ncbi:hypothetical protein JCM17960_20470 [Magnetospira thiophila]